jgi:mRNA-degrading endonuclease RelE of RelBE toxin-antitoxin system
MPHHSPMSTRLIVVKESSVFTRRADKLLSPAEREELVNFLAANPTEGDVIPDLGGIRKVRFAAKGKGKSGGVRVIYYFHDDSVPLYALIIYGKGEQEELTPDQQIAAAGMVSVFKLMELKKRGKR